MDWKMGMQSREKLCFTSESQPCNQKNFPWAPAHCCPDTTISGTSQDWAPIVGWEYYSSTPFTCYLSVVISECSYLRLNFLSKLTFWALYDPSLAKDSYNWIAAVMFCMPKFPNRKAILHSFQISQVSCFGKEYVGSVPRI